MIERGQDPRRERRRATALNQADQRVQIDAGLMRELFCQRGVEAGLAEPRAAPGNRVRRFSIASRPSFASRLSALSGLSVGPEVHAYLAPARAPFLRGESNYRAQGGRGGTKSPPRPPSPPSSSGSRRQLARALRRGV